MTGLFSLFSCGHSGREASANRPEKDRRKFVTEVADSQQ
jgi:hypothetical protein